MLCCGDLFVVKNGAIPESVHHRPSTLCVCLSVVIGTSS